MRQDPPPTNEEWMSKDKYPSSSLSVEGWIWCLLPSPSEGPPKHCTPDVHRVIHPLTDLSWLSPLPFLTSLSPTNNLHLHPCLRAPLLWGKLKPRQAVFAPADQWLSWSGSTVWSLRTASQKHWVGSQKDPILGLMLCCFHLEILHKFILNLCFVSGIWWDNRACA